MLGLSWRLQLDDSYDIGEIRTTLGGFGNIYSVCGYLHVPLSLHQRVSSLHTLLDQSERKWILMVVVVINLSQSAFRKSFAKHLASINCTTASYEGSNSVPSSRGHCPLHAYIHRGCDHPSSASSA
jgi:hypothetical protein